MSNFNFDNDIRLLIEKNALWMSNAKNNKDDEYYTKMESCINEFDNYSEFFNNKIIYCNCDNPQRSNIVKYFKNNFERLNLKKLYATWYGSDSAIYEFDGYDETYTEIIHPHTGSFDSPESIEVLKKCDIVVTNIPFSNGLPKAFISLMIKYNKKYITTVSSLSMVTSWARPFITNGDIIPGFTIIKFFDRPEGVTNNKEGKVDTMWITNINVRNNENLICKYSYSQIKKLKDKKIRDIVYIQSLHKYVLYIKKVRFIPYDYKDEMLVPYNFFYYYKPEEFKIITTVTAHKKNNKYSGYAPGFIIKRKSSLNESLFDDDIFNNDNIESNVNLESKILLVDFVDLDLPSGTLWATENYTFPNETDSLKDHRCPEHGSYVTYEEAIKLTNNSFILMPSIDQFKELINNCNIINIKRFDVPGSLEDSEYGIYTLKSKKNGHKLKLYFGEWCCINHTYLTNTVKDGYYYCLDIMYNDVRREPTFLNELNHSSPRGALRLVKNKK